MGPWVRPSWFLLLPAKGTELLGKYWWGGHILPTATLQGQPEIVVCIHSEQNIYSWGLPWCTVDRNPPARAGDMHLIPGLGRFHMPQSN